MWQGLVAIFYIIYPAIGEGDVGYFWHVTDIHYDPEYSQMGSAKSMCHHLANQSLNYGEVGHYGDFRCDCPMALLKSAIDAMVRVRPDPDFVLWTGDNSAHVEGVTWPQVYSDTRLLGRLLERAFNRSRIVPTLGNHDCIPTNQMSTREGGAYRNFLSRGGLDQILPSSAWDTFMEGGFYSLLVGKELRLLSLNSVLWYAINRETRNATDPAKQMCWLEEQLRQARAAQEKVYISGHIAPGFNNRANLGQLGFQMYHPFFAKKFNGLMSEYADVVVAQFYGHQHCNGFMLVSGGAGAVSTSAHLAGSVTPWGSSWAKSANISVPVNPSVRLYKYDRLTGTPLDYTVFFLNLTRANADYEQARAANRAPPDPMWEPLYTFTTAYDIPDASTASLLALHAKMAAAEDVLVRYVRFTTSLKDLGPCDEFCVRLQLCSAGHTDAKEYRDCMRGRVEADTGMPRFDARKHPAHHFAPPGHGHVADHEATTFRDVAIGLSVSLLIVVCIVLAVRAKRASMLTGPRYANFT